MAHLRKAMSVRREINEREGRDYEKNTTTGTHKVTDSCAKYTV